ncbi:hypothetical protein ACH5RR_001402 [Cinchona calisaya]|uniref:BHLH domain-containing protein n=1 Tax=Cinchona calisaya TaxID=153742 RepID=A0ABD3B3J5_9GENT
MALQTVLYQQDVFGNSNKDQYNLFGGGNLGRDTDLAEKFESSSFDFFQENIEENSPPFPTVEQSEQWALNAASEHEISAQKLPDSRSPMSNRSRRRCLRPKKNQEEIEHQRMAHIAVERNRRKQMNEYLSVLRDLVPEGYVQKGDQASIVGGAMNYVKELEQQLQFLDGQNHMNDQYYETGILSSSSFPFSEFFSFPQYSTTVTGSENASTTRPITDLASNSWTNRNRLAAADIEVTMVENHANLKVRTKKRPKQLTKMVSGLQSLRLTVLHLNVTTADQIVLYSISVKVENDCKLTSVDEIAGAVNKILREIQEEVAALMG